MLPKEGDKVEIRDSSLQGHLPSADNERQRWKLEEQFGTPWNEECGKVGTQLVWIPVKAFCFQPPLFFLNFSIAFHLLNCSHHVLRYHPSILDIGSDFQTSISTSEGSSWQRVFKRRFFPG
jgi:hypothetical protein